ncbi:MAG: hypothetical protein ABIT01_10845 [Thermoanaerobaculia bacterium]
MKSRLVRLAGAASLCALILACVVSNVVGPSSVHTGQVVTYQLAYGTNTLCFPRSPYTPALIVDLPADWTLNSVTYVGSGTVSPPSGVGTVTTACPVIAATAVPAGFQRICLTGPLVTFQPPADTAIVSVKVTVGNVTGPHTLQFWGGGTWTGNGGGTCVQPTPSTFAVTETTPVMLQSFEAE